jgi:hypothetical protein
VKGLYAKAIKGEVQNFTGISDPYEPPTNPDVIVSTEKETIEESLKKIIDGLQNARLIPGIGRSRTHEAPGSPKAVRDDMPASTGLIYGSL